MLSQLNGLVARLLEGSLVLFFRHWFIPIVLSAGEDNDPI